MSQLIYRPLADPSEFSLFEAFPDVGNAPMAASSARCGDRVVGRRVIVV